MRSWAGEADNQFVAAVIAIGLLSMLAVVSAVLVWQWRAHRGPGMATALWIGQIAAGAAAAGWERHWRTRDTARQTTPAHNCHRTTGCSTSPRLRPCSSATVHCRLP